MKLKILVNITRIYLQNFSSHFLKFLHFSNFFPPNLNYYTRDKKCLNRRMLKTSWKKERKKNSKNSSRRKRNAQENFSERKIYVYIYFEVSAQSLYVHRKCCSSFVKKNEPISRREEKYHPAKGRGDEVLGGVSTKSLIKTGTTGNKGERDVERRCNRIRWIGEGDVE